MMMQKREKGAGAENLIRSVTKGIGQGIGIGIRQGQVPVPVVKTFL